MKNIKRETLRKLGIKTSTHAGAMLTTEGHAYRRFCARRSYARKNNIPFDISLEYVISLITKNCPILGIPLTWCEKSKSVTDGSPSLDKILPEKGYVEGNVAWISYKANRIKNSGTAEEHLKIYKFINKYHNAE